MSKDKQVSTKPVRVSLDNIKLLKRLKKDMALKSYDQVLHDLIETHQIYNSADRKRYVVNGQVFEDASEARGFAILNAMEKGEVPTLPEVYAFLDYDELD